MNQISIDNWTFKLFYKATTTILLACSLLCGTKQFFGEPINCDVVRQRTNIFVSDFCSLAWRWGGWRGVEQLLLDVFLLQDSSWFQGNFVRTHWQKYSLQRVFKNARQDLYLGIGGTIKIFFCTRATAAKGIMMGRICTTATISGWPSFLFVRWTTNLVLIQVSGEQ